MRSVILSLCAALCLASAAAAVDIPNRIANAKPGEWALMADVSGEESGETTKVTLLAIDGESFTIRREHFGADGAVIETDDHTIPLADYNARMESMAARAQEIAEEFVYIKGTEYPVVSVLIVSERKDENGNDRQFKIWLSADLPIGGVAKTWSSDVAFPSAEVVDFGF